MNKKECPSCSKLLLEKANFCGRCKTQIKCLICKEEIGIEDLCCESCGADIKRRSMDGNQALNKIRYDGKTFDAEFTDTVGKDVTETFGQIFMANQKRLIDNSLSKPENIKNISKEDEETIDIEGEEITLNEKANSEQNASNKPVEGNHLIDQEYPNINDLEIKKSFKEPEWIIVYAFYASNFGSNLFSKPVVRATYKEKRDTDNRMKNFGQSWKSAYKKAFKTQKDSELKFTPDGLIFVNALIFDNEKSKPKNKSISKDSSSKSKKVPSKNVKVEEFDVFNSKLTLEEFLNNLGNPTSTKEVILAIGYYIKNTLGQDIFTDGQIDYAYKVLNLSNRPNYLRQIVTNIKNDKLWIDAEDDKAWSVSRAGEIFIEKVLNRKVDED